MRLPCLQGAPLQWAWQTGKQITGLKKSIEEQSGGGWGYEEEATYSAGVLEEVTRKSLSLPGGLQAARVSQEWHTEHSGNCKDRVCRMECQQICLKRLEKVRLQRTFRPG